jgi:hypothetical protein
MTALDLLRMMPVYEFIMEAIGGSLQVEDS